MQASQTSRGIVLTLDDVLFDTGKAQLKPGAQRSIDQIAAFLNENPERRVQIEGFTDSQGTDDYNLELSQSRADAVAMAIIQRGIDAQRVRALGYGEGFPGRQQRQCRQPPAQSPRRDHRLQRRRRDSRPRGRGHAVKTAEILLGGFRRAVSLPRRRRRAARRAARTARCGSSAIRPASRRCASSSRASRRRIRPCSSAAKAAAARSWSPSPCTP